MEFLERFASLLGPIRGYLVPFDGFDPLIALILTMLVAVVILQNRRKNQSVTGDVENLIRRYIIFRGHRQALMKVHRDDEKLKYQMLKAMSVSWNHFKGMLENHSTALRETDRRARNILCILALVMLANSFRILAAGRMSLRGNWDDLIFLMKELPVYLFLFTGLLLISMQSRRWKRRSLMNFTGELEAIFSDTEKTQEDLNNEFDPIDESFQERESWPEES